MNVHGFEKTSLEIMDALLDDDDVHGVIFISFSLWGSEPHHPLAELVSEKRNKPVFFSLLGSKDDVRLCGDYLKQQRIPCIFFRKRRCAFSKECTGSRSVWDWRIEPWAVSAF